MKFQIFTETEKPETLLRLKLHMVRDGDVILSVVGNDGQVIPGGNILYISTYGHIQINGGVDPKLGFKLDAAGRVVTV